MTFSSFYPLWDSKEKKKKPNKSVREDGVYVTFSKKISTIKMLVLSILEVISPVLQFFILDYMTQ